MGKPLVNNFIEKLEKVGVSLKKKKKLRMIVDILLLPSDLQKIYRTYCSTFGEYPRLFRPKTFNDWMQWSKIFNRKKVHTVIADKFRVREYIRRVAGDSLLSEVYWVGVDLSDFDIDSAPSSFVVKSNNGSGTNIIVKDKSNINWDEVVAATKSWLLNDQSMYYAEWQYRWIEPLILVEEYLEDPVRGYLVEYQFFCVNGRCEFVEVDFDRHGRHSRLFYGRDFRLIDLKIRLPVFCQDYVVSKNAHEMLQVAEKLASGHKFLRVDFYDLEHPKIGELTLHPGAGMVKFEPHSWNTYLGKKLTSGSA